MAAIRVVKQTGFPKGFIGKQLVSRCVKNYLFYIISERMDGCNRFGKQFTLDDRWMAQSAPLRKNE